MEMIQGRDRIRWCYCGPIGWERLVLFSKLTRPKMIMAVVPSLKWSFVVFHYKKDIPGCLSLKCFLRLSFLVKDLTQPATEHEKRGREFRS
jgi:hypothetical protein